MEHTKTRASLLNSLNLSLHGDFAKYTPIVSDFCRTDAEFVAHLIAWDFTNGQIKDTKTALPVITLGSRDFPDELVDNSLAHLALQPPRELLKALKFSIASSTPARRQKQLEKMIRRYLASKESQAGKWIHLAVRHRRSLKSLYALTHYKVPRWAYRILFENNYAPGSIFADIRDLGKMTPVRAAATIQKWHLSPLIVTGAMAGSKANQDDSAVVQATMEQMSSTEVVKNARKLEARHGVSKNKTLKETFRSKVAKATTSSKATLKTSEAADEVEDESMKTMLRELQERQIQAQKDAGRGIEGNWLVICDRSQSQQQAIEIGVHIAAAITKFVTGKVYLVFCNDTVIPFDVTGRPLEEIKQKTKLIIASGSTSYGIGLAWAVEKKIPLDGVVIVGDGGENTPPVYAAAHIEYKKRYDKSLPTYLYKTFCPAEYQNMHSGGYPGQFAGFMNYAQIQFTEFDLTSGKVDYYSIPNMVQGMSASRFGVEEKIMACPLLELAKVLPVEELVGR